MGKIYVQNMNGVWMEFANAVNFMDDELREALHNEGYNDTQSFFTAYEKAHEAKHGEEWELSKLNPTY